MVELEPDLGKPAGCTGGGSQSGIKVKKINPNSTITNQGLFSRQNAKGMHNYVKSN